MIFLLLHNNNDDINISTDEYWAILRKIVWEPRKVMYNFVFIRVGERGILARPSKLKKCYADQCKQNKFGSVLVKEHVLYGFLCS